MFDDRKLGNPWRAISSGPPQNVSTSRSGSHRHFSLVKNLATPRSLTRDRAVIWRMSADSTSFWAGSETLTVAHCDIAIDLACSLT
jgi:hypothetical protein